ncbi:MAG: hypothetical protein IPL46_17960 [Saprospiraceae bacterium]|nr:hypothetical protein [Saprospiraceae bacterium]
MVKGRAHCIGFADGRLDDNVVEGTPLTHLGSSTGYMDIARVPITIAMADMLVVGFADRGMPGADAQLPQIVRQDLDLINGSKNKLFFEAPDPYYG